MYKLVILTEAGPQLGFGHLTRCESIQKQFLAQGWASEIFVHIADPSGQTQLRAHHTNWWNDRILVSRLMSEANLVLLDSFEAPIATLDLVTSESTQFAVIDDFPRRVYKRGSVIDWTIDAENRFYLNRQPSVRYLLGGSFCSLRPAFWDIPKRQPRILKSIFITFGGSDIRSITIPCIQALAPALPELNFQVVAPEATARAITGRYPNVVVQSGVSDTQMRDLMIAADIAISGGGQTLYELAACGLPAVVIELIDNQLDDITGFAAKGFIDYVGSWNTSNLWDKVKERLSDLCDPQIRLKKSMSGQSLIDGKGVYRLTQALIESSET